MTYDSIVNLIQGYLFIGYWLVSVVFVDFVIWDNFETKLRMDIGWFGAFVILPLFFGWIVAPFFLIYVLWDRFLRIE